MSAKAAPAPVRHVHLHIDLDPETEVFQYRAVVNGEHTTLHHGDSITFRSKDRFSIVFDSESPFLRPDEKQLDAHSESGEWIIAAEVRADAPPRRYLYTVKMSKLSRTFTDEPHEFRVVHGDPEIIIEQV